MLKNYSKTLVLTIASASLLSGCAMIEGAGKDFQNWGNYLDRQFNQNQNASSPAQLQSVAVNDANCPTIEQRPEFSSLHEFVDPTKPEMNTKMASVDIAQVNNRCNREGAFLSVTMDITFNSMLGPKGRANASDRPFFSFPYFIAVMDENDTVLAKEVFAVSVSYEEGEQAISTIETIKQNLPLNEDGTLPNYKMQVGFELSEEQIAYNRGL